MIIQSGSKNIVVNTWSDAAREAALAARQKGQYTDANNAENAVTTQQHKNAIAHHIHYANTTTGKAMIAHLDAARLHSDVVSGGRGGMEEAENRIKAHAASIKAHDIHPVSAKIAESN